MATRTVSNVGGNYSSTSTWVEGIVPTSVDDIVFTATSGNLVINVTLPTAPSECQSIDFTNFTGTITFNVNCALHVRNALVLNPTVTYIRNNLFIVLTGNCTVTSNGTDLQQPLSISGDNNTITFADTYRGSSISCTNSGVATTTTLNGGFLYLKAFSLINNNIFVTGTVTLYFNQAGASSIAGTNIRYMGCKIVIDTPDTFSFSALVAFRNCEIVYVRGTISWPTSQFVIQGSMVFDFKGLSAPVAITTQGVTTTLNLISDFNIITLSPSGPFTFTGLGMITLTNLALSGATTLTLSHDLYVDSFQNNAGGNSIAVNNFSIYFKSMLINGVSLGGTTNFITNGLTIIEESNVSAYFVSVPLVFAKNSTVKLRAPRFSYGGSTWLIETTNIEYTKDAILRVGTGTIINAHKLKFKVVNFQTNSTVLTLNEFFQGTALRPCVVNGVTIGNITSDVLFTDTKKKYTKFTKIKLLDLPAGQLISTTANFRKGNGGRDVDGGKIAVFYGGQTAYGAPLHLDIFDDKTSWPASLLADPTTSSL